MRIRMLVHSTTGNTRLVARYAAGVLRRQGHLCELHDIVADRQPPDFAEVDLLGVAAPTMYFRPTIAMERFVLRMPNAPAPAPRPAFLLATNGGMPGAHFALLAEWLRHKGWAAAAAHFVPFPGNWPVHRAPLERLEPTAFVGEWLVRNAPRPLRALWGTVWTDSVEPDDDDRRDLDRFLERLPERVTGPAPRTSALYDPFPGTALVGRMFPTDRVDDGVRIAIDAGRCNRCGVCIRVCPAGVLTRSEATEVPRVGTGCTGCYACFNRCPEGAIGGLGAPTGRGRYVGPSPAVRDRFRAPDAG